MIRGGGWNNNAEHCQSSIRNRNTPENRNNNLGFRPAAPLAQPFGAPPMEQARCPDLRKPAKR